MFFVYFNKDAYIWNRGTQVFNRVARKSGIVAQEFGIGYLFLTIGQQVFAEISGTFQLRAMRPSAH